MGSCPRATNPGNQLKSPFDHPLDPLLARKGRKSDLREAIKTAD
jgi:hypothetical protein